jgi:hypothetical protein
LGVLHPGQNLSRLFVDAKGKIFVRIAEANKWYQVSEKDCDTIIKEYSSIRYVFTANEIWEMYISK